MEDQTLLFLGSGLGAGGILLGPIIGVILAVKESSKGFRYGAFFLGTSMVLVPLFGAASVCFYYQFLSEGGLAHSVAIPTALVTIGVIIAFFCLPFRSKSLFIIVSFPYLAGIYLAPLFIFNLIYIFKIYQPADTSSLPPAAAPTS